MIHVTNDPAHIQPAVLITGSSGFLGSAIIDRLAASYRIFAFDIKEPEVPLPGNAEFTRMDLTSDESVRTVLGGLADRGLTTIASVIHLAAYYNFSGEPSDMYRKLTVAGTERLLKALQGMDVEQFLFTSTMLVYAPCLPGERINEESALDPKWDYPRSKVTTEELIREKKENISSVILRVAGVYDDAGHSIPISHQIQRIYEDRLTSHVFPGDSSRGQAFIHIDDLAEAIAKIVDKRQDLGEEEIFVIGEPETYGYKEIQKKLGQLIHHQDSWDTQKVPKPFAKTGAWIQDRIPGMESPFIKPWMIDIADDHYELDISRARRRLGWEPRRRLIDTLEKMVAALKSDPVGWYEENGLPVPEKVRQHQPSHA